MGGGRQLAEKICLADISGPSDIVHGSVIMIFFMPNLLN